jgi:NAD(P)H-hydrate epimerase
MHKGHYLYSAAQVRELDRIVIEKFGISGYELMQRAGSFAYNILNKYFSKTFSIYVFCGRGNNAGDGYVLAKLAIEDDKYDREVIVINCFNPEKLEGDAKTAYQDLVTMKYNKEKVEIWDHSDLRKKNPSSTSVYVDAIFGTGLTRDINDENLVHTIEVLNNHNMLVGEGISNEYEGVLSIDIPSGLNADTGNIMGVAVNANVTATFMGHKRGMFTHDGREYSGQIEFDRLDIPSKSYFELEEDNHCYLAKYNDLEYYQNIPARKRNAHKGNFGHVLLIGGDEGYLGAAHMAAEAAMRVGSGLVSVATRKSHAAQLSITVPEVMSHGVETLDELMPLIKRATVIAIGPGLGQSEWAKLLFARILESDLPIIIDADALNLLAEEEQSSPNWVITPHPGEAARLLKTDVTTIQSDRFQSARDLHEKYHGPVVLKGAGSVVTDLEGNLYVCSEGNPGMSTGGMGDVLTGVIAGLVAQGVDIESATQIGVLMHARAADMAVFDGGERGMIATDLMPYLRELSNPDLYFSNT